MNTVVSEPKHVTYPIAPELIPGEKRMKFQLILLSGVYLMALGILLVWVIIPFMADITRSLIGASDTPLVPWSVHAVVILGLTVIGLLAWWVERIISFLLGYFYRNVSAGEVLRMTNDDSLYGVCIKGENRSGQLRTAWHPITPEEFYTNKYQAGMYVDFTKKTKQG